MRITTADQAAPARRATADAQVRRMKQNPLFSHLIEVWCLGDFTAVTTQVIPRNIVRDKEDEVGLPGFKK